MSEDDLVRDKKGNVINIESELFEDWQIKLLRKLREWFPKKEVSS